METRGGSGRSGASALDDRVLKVLGALCVATLLLELFLHRHPVLPFQGWLGFDGISGALALVVLAFGARWLQRLLLRGEDYYG